MTSLIKEEAQIKNFPSFLYATDVIFKLANFPTGAFLKLWFSEKLEPGYFFSKISTFSNKHSESMVNIMKLLTMVSCLQNTQKIGVFSWTRSAKPSSIPASNYPSQTSWLQIYFNWGHKFECNNCKQCFGHFTIWGVISSKYRWAEEGHCVG